MYEREIYHWNLQELPSGFCLDVNNEAELIANISLLFERA
jgi:hypothetical protein